MSQKTDSNCPIVIFVSLLALPHYDTILHIAVIMIFIYGSHIFLFFLKNYFQFYPSRKALVIKTNVFTIITNLNPFLRTQILIDREIELYECSNLLTVFFLLFFFFLLLVCFCFLFSFFFLLLLFQHVAVSSSFLFFFCSFHIGVLFFFFFLFFLFSGGLVFSLIVSVETQSVTIS